VILELIRVRMVGLGLGLHVNLLGDVFDENLNCWKLASRLIS
jgi:hypothetical protein